MPKKDDHVIGIDLGTTMSAVSITDDIGNVKTIPNSLGSKLTPSAVLVTANEILVGQKAIDQALDFPNTFAECFKRSIGQAAYPTEIKGYKVPPEILSAFLIKSLKQDAENAIGQQITKAVITVPAFYGSQRRQATRLAGELAGLNVLDIVNEPTAAALTYGFRHNLFKDSESSKRIMVFDLGGGTFDVSLLEFSKNQFKTLATDGNVQLGGRDFDAAIKDHVASKFMDAYGVDPRSKIENLIDLFARSKQAKHELSTADETTVNCNFEGMRLSLAITRSTFQELIETHLDLALYTCESVLQTQKMQWADLDHVLFVGGSCRIPFVGQRIKEKTGIEPVTAKDPDEIVAQGAALFAASKSMDESVGFEIVNVNSHSLGIAGVNTATKEKINQILIPRNTPLPAVVKQKFVTHKDGQRGVSLTLLEGESTIPKFCTVVAKSAILLAPDTPAGTDIEVICQCLEDGTIHVSARVLKDRKSTSLEVRRERATSFDSLEVWTAKLLNLETQETGSTSAIPDLPVNNGEAITGSDSQGLDAAINYQYQEMGKIAFAAVLIPELIPQRRAIQRSIDELIFFRRIIKKLERKEVGDMDSVRKREWEEKVQRAKSELTNLQLFAQHCRVVLGRECIQREFLPPGTERFVDQVKKLQALSK